MATHKHKWVFAGAALDVTPRGAWRVSSTWRCTRCGGVRQSKPVALRRPAPTAAVSMGGAQGAQISGDDAVGMLVSLGFSAGEAVTLLKGADAGASIEDRVRFALGKVGQQRGA